MEKAQNIEKFVKGVAEELGMGGTVWYDLQSLTYGAVHQSDFDEYGDLLDEDELPDGFEDEHPAWMVEVVSELRQILDLPESLEPPTTREQKEWMADFANEQHRGSRYAREVQRALDSRHPFSAFKSVMDSYGLLSEWYKYRDARCIDYAKSQLPL